ncbi:hypothetical protein AYI68_g3742, partial [Smittium mucronatum]
MPKYLQCLVSRFQPQSPPLQPLKMFASQGLKHIEKYDESKSTAASSIFPDDDIDTHFSNIDYETYKRLYSSLLFPTDKLNSLSTDSLSLQNYHLAEDKADPEKENPEDTIKSLIYFKQLLNLPVNLLVQEPALIRSEIERSNDALLNILYNAPSSLQNSISNYTDAKDLSKSAALDKRSAGSLYTSSFENDCDKDKIFLEISDSYDTIISSCKDIDFKVSEIDQKIENISKLSSKATRLISDIDKSRELSNNLNSYQDTILQLIELPKLFRQYVNSNRYIEAIEIFENIINFANEFQNIHSIPKTMPLRELFSTSVGSKNYLYSYKPLNINTLLVPNVSIRSQNLSIIGSNASNNSTPNLVVSVLVDNVVSKAYNEFYLLVIQVISELSSAIASLHKPSRHSFMNSPSNTPTSAPKKIPAGKTTISGFLVESEIGVSKAAQRLSSIADSISVLRQMNIFPEKNEIEMLYCQIQWDVFLSICNSFGLNSGVLEALSFKKKYSEFLDKVGNNPEHNNAFNRMSFSSPYLKRSVSSGSFMEYYRKYSKNSPKMGDRDISIKQFNADRFDTPKKLSSSKTLDKSAEYSSSPVPQTPIPLFGGPGSNSLGDLTNFSQSFVDWLVDLSTQHGYIFSYYNQSLSGSESSNSFGKKIKSRILDSLVARTCEIMIVVAKTSLVCFGGNSGVIGDDSKAVLRAIDQFGWQSEKLSTHGYDFIGSKVMPDLIELAISIVCINIRAASSDVSKELEAANSQYIAEFVEISGDKDIKPGDNNKSRDQDDFASYNKRVGDYIGKSWWIRFKSLSKTKLPNTNSDTDIAEKKDEKWKAVLSGHRVSGVDILQYPVIAALYHSFRRITLSITSLLKTDVIQASDEDAELLASFANVEKSAGVSLKQIEILNVLTCCFECDLLQISNEIRICFDNLKDLDGTLLKNKENQNKEQASTEDPHSVSSQLKKAMFIISEFAV